MKHFPFKVISDGDDKPLIEVKYRGEVKRFTVITVPAYFTDA